MASSPLDLFGAGQLPAMPQMFAPAPGGGNSPLQPPAESAALPPSGLPSPTSPSLNSALSFVRTSEPPLEPAARTVLQRMGPDTELGKKVLEKLDAMQQFSERQMKQHYARWNFAEEKIQAYTNMPDYEKIVGEWQQNGSRKGFLPPEPVQLTVPYSYATLHAAATFIASVLLGRKPIFPLLATRGTASERARYMEQAVQSNLDASRGYETLWQKIWDSLIYGFGPSRNTWENRTGPAIRWIGGRRETVTEQTFAGNVISAVDPYAYFPDPRVPLHQTNTRGDFIFTEMELSETALKDLEKSGDLMWVKAALAKKGSGVYRSGRSSEQNRRRVKIGVAGETLMTPTNVTGFHPVFEGTVRLVPKDWGLGDSDRSELWKFTWIKKCQIMQAEPLGMIHGEHPYTAGEPTSLGHDFMSLSMADMIGPFQDILSWLVSSRMENVRTSVNNQFVADPARVEVNDIRASPIGRIIRLKQAAMGLPVQEAIMQLATQDVTQGHIADIQTSRILADTITGVNDNMRGIQSAGGRRSATEARMSMQAGGSRLSQLAIRLSSQDFLQLVNQMIMNIQQFMPDKMWVEVTGDEGSASLQMTPEMLVGSFNYQMSDGSLPYDKTALVEVWKEILFGIAQDPQLRQEYNLGKIFRHVAELGGAKNIDSFVNQQPPMQVGAAADPGAMPGAAPMGAAMPAGPITPAQIFQATGQ
jgi:hypothetical protein